MSRHGSELPGRDRLLCKRQCARLLDMKPRDWPAYYRQWPVLVAGRRYRPLRPGTGARPRWLLSALVAHMHQDLRSQPPVPQALPPAARASQEAASTAAARRA